MPTTAYSKHFARELDVEQLAALLRADQPQMQQQHDDIEASLREWTRSDILCGSCGNSGAQIVQSGATSRTSGASRKAHFRFVGQNGADSHHPFCEFHCDSEVEDQPPENLVSFGSARTQETRLIRELVCKGIELRVFDQSSIRKMRQWFFDLKASTRFLVDVPPEAIDWVRHLQRHPSHFRWAFQPIQAEMPNFDWRQAAIYQFTEENFPLFALARRAPHDAEHQRKARELAIRYKHKETFSALELKPFYERTVSLCTFVAMNSGKKFNSVSPHHYGFKGAPVSLVALCALVLFISDWSMDGAVEKLVKIFAAPPPADFSLGNVMGLNPFHDYASWQVIVVAGDIARQSPNGFDYAGQLSTLEARLREEHRLWRHSNRES